MEQIDISQVREFKKAIFHKMSSTSMPEFNELVHWTKLGDWLLAIDSSNNYRLLSYKRDDKASKLIRQDSKITLLEHHLKINLNNDSSIYAHKDMVHSTQMFIGLTHYLVSKEDLHIYVAQDFRECEILTLSRQAPKRLNQILQIPLYWDSRM